MLLPILGDQYGRVLEKGELKLEFEQGAFFLGYFALRLPLNPRSYGADPASARWSCSKLPAEDAVFHRAPKHHHRHRAPAAAHGNRSGESGRAGAREGSHQAPAGAALRAKTPPCAEAIDEARARLQRHGGRPAQLRRAGRIDRRSRPTGSASGGWRRRRSTTGGFSTSTALAAIRMELPEVFEATHRLISELIKTARSTGCGSTTWMAFGIRANTWSNCRPATAKFPVSGENECGPLLAGGKNPHVRREAAPGMAGARHHRLRFHESDHSRCWWTRMRRKSLHRDVPRASSGNGRALPTSSTRTKQADHAAFAGQRGERARAHAQPSLARKTAGIATSP